ncbi:hypothetical protein N7532_010270 [Penicillium argentinense]|uniref:Uncharacterized protein n=1 Tax=Penicillium argentinense TaxID=1131581 RepID=A0A9W9JXH0_9EURO|nr:uncharacterized protein N7532_010270 [Penicillium argentinense]KAJ5085499.1 hypothetical protein N7532_010270 [Penicillium argentinense]
MSLRVNLDKPYGQRMFEAHRYDAYKELENISVELGEQQDSYEVLADRLSKCCADIDKIEERAKLEKENGQADVSSCFHKRCELLKLLINAVSIILRLTPVMKSRAELMTGALSSQVGRLTLQAHTDRSDLAARHMDNECFMLNLSWNSLSGEQSSKIQRSQQVLAENWHKLNMPVEGCDCLQCTKRLHLEQN